MEELQVIETTSGRQFKPWASKEEVQAIGQAVVQAVLDPASVTAIASEIAGGKAAIASAINAKGGTADPLASFQQLADDVVNLNDSFITYGVEVTEKIHWLKFICEPSPVPRLPLTAIDDDVVTTISQPNCFQNCTALERVKMTALTIISGTSAFLNCTALQEVNIPSLTALNAKGAFENCTALQEVNIPSLTAISGNSAFQNCAALQEVNIPSLTAISGVNVFYSCNALRNVIFGKLATLADPFVGSKPSLRNITIGQDTNINLPFQNWTATNVIAEGQSGIDELNSNIMTNLVPNLYLNGGKTLRLGAALYDVLTTATKDAITDRGWTLQRG